MAAHRDALAGVLPVVAAHAGEVDRDGRFPHEAIEALRAGGLLGLLEPVDLGGMGQGLKAAAEVVEALARHCGSTAMITTMHYAAAAVIGAHGPEAIRRRIAGGTCLATIAFSEFGAAAQFWAPISTATATEAGVRLDARKSWVTSAAEADVYVWSSRPVAAEGVMTLWLVPSDAPGLCVGGQFDGLGLRGNGSVPVSAEGVVVVAGARLGADGGGLDVAIGAILPSFLVLNAAFSVGVAEAVTAEATEHVTRATRGRLETGLADDPIPRADLARMRIATDSAAALLADTVTAWTRGRPEALLRVLEIKASASETALAVTELAMKVCGGSAFRKELGVERRFRDARAARVMAPNTDALYEFLGRVLCGLPLLGGESH